MTESPTSAGPPSGWYADSPHAPRLRWWTGSEWTDHYRDVQDAQPGEPTQPLATETPKSRAERRAALAAAEVQPPPPAVAEPEPEPEAPFPIAKPDMVLDRSLRTIDDRMPQPIVYRPTNAVPVHTGPQRSTFFPVSRNSYATASLVLSIFGTIGFALSYWWLADAAPQAAPIVAIASLGVTVVALALAAVAIVVAVQRPTRKALSVTAVIVAPIAVAFVAGFPTLARVLEFG